MRSGEHGGYNNYYHDCNIGAAVDDCPIRGSGYGSRWSQGLQQPGSSQCHFQARQGRGQSQVTGVWLTRDFAVNAIFAKAGGCKDDSGNGKSRQVGRGGGGHGQVGILLLCF